MSDLVLELPVSLAQGDARGPWRIVEPLEKLKEKYGEESGVFNSVEFDRYAAARAEEDPDWTHPAPDTPQRRGTAFLPLQIAADRSSQRKWT